MIDERSPELADYRVMTMKWCLRSVDLGFPGLSMGIDPGYEHAKEVKQRYTSSLMALERVVGVGVSKKPGQDPDQGRWVIVVYVSKKIPPHQIDSRSMVPQQIEGVPTDVVETGQPIPYLTK
jgi:hypothetical protein